VPQWIQEHETILLWLVGASVLAFVVSLIVVPILVVRLPADYFAHGRREHTRWADAHPVIRVALLIAKNAFGVVFLVVGLVMLLTPGQGLLTMVIGVVLLDFPGRYRLERWVVSKRPVLRAMNWLREKADRPPLVPWGDYVA
jgi:archaellum biogenesis protein FlaJ (TadC family)